MGVEVLAVLGGDRDPKLRRGGGGLDIGVSELGIDQFQVTSEHRPYSAAARNAVRKGSSASGVGAWCSLIIRLATSKISWRVPA